MSEEEVLDEKNDVDGEIVYIDEMLEYGEEFGKTNGFKTDSVLDKLFCRVTELSHSLRFTDIGFDGAQSGIIFKMIKYLFGKFMGKTAIEHIAKQSSKPEMVKDIFQKYFKKFIDVFVESDIDFDQSDFESNIENFYDKMQEIITNVLIDSSAKYKGLAQFVMKRGLKQLELQELTPQILVQMNMKLHSKSSKYLMGLLKMAKKGEKELKFRIIAAEIDIENKICTAMQNEFGLIPLVNNGLDVEKWMLFQILMLTVCGSLTVVTKDFDENYNVDDFLDDKNLPSAKKRRLL